MTPQIVNRQSSIGNPEPRHFAWELFSAGPAVQRDGRSLHEVPVAVGGSWVKDGRTFTVTSEDLRRMVANFEKRKNDMLVIDYEHASEQPEVARGGPVPAAGWILGLAVVRRPARVAADNGRPSTEVLTARVEWTPEARELIRSGQYRFFSPAIDWSARDKETGQPQGATLTSGALTNHPFLEELPPLMLTDLAAAPPEAERRRTTISGPESGRHEGETAMEMKRLSIRKLTEGPQAGHHGIFYGDDPVGYMTDEDFAQYASRHLPGAATGPGGELRNVAATEEGTLSLLFAERVGAGGAGLDEIRELLDAGRRARTRESEAAARALILSEVVRDGRVRSERALELARHQKISLADYVAVQAAERALDYAVGEGKILPRERRFFFRDALERPQEFAEFVERAVPAVRLGSEGIGAGEAIPIDQEVDLGVRRLMSEHKTSYAKALKALFRENPALETRYRAAHSRRLEADAPSAEAAASAGVTQ
ncbi:MAG TPA: phage protease [Terriglobia bacterium]|nr:phage protease [Terriglobia bacterium]